MKNSEVLSLRVGLRMRRDPKHLAFIRRLFCCACGGAGPEAAHLRRGSDGGIGLKPSDCYVVPLCGRCHRKQHSDGEITFWGCMDKVHDLARALFEVSGDITEGTILTFRFQQAHNGNRSRNT